ncbi:MAG: NAD-dependent epimerase/dehydratase family protein [Anaerolineales bacterium]|nr:NAD-dependent epimerase/dehydratase family protein [Anaerolineales bacterium]
MRILVTGGTGFLGSHLTRRLLDLHQDVRILGRDFNAVTALVQAGATPIPADLTTHQAVVDACAGMDVVFHVAALSAPWGAAANFYATNVDGTAAVVKGCAQHGVKRLVYVSSPSVVFDGRDQIDVNELAPYPHQFTSTYAKTKKLGEDLVNNAAAAGLDTVTLRPKAIFGPGDRALLPRLIAAARQGRLRRFGDGSNLVDLTYIDNVVQALVLAMQAPAAQGRTYFITNDEHPALWPLIECVLHELGLPPLRGMPVSVAMSAARMMETQSVFTRREPLLTRYTVAILTRTQTYDISAARTDLSYAPHVSVAEGIRRTLVALRS